MGGSVSLFGLEQPVNVDPEQWPALSRLLDEALELPHEARERWLNSLPPSDAQYQQSLRALLCHDRGSRTRDFRDVLPSLTLVQALASPTPGGWVVGPGVTVGPYVLEKEIGRGGMGSVWRARRSDGVIKRPVAVKLPHVGLHGRDPIERFERERDILAQLAHPNIARLYDAGFSAAGQPFIALEYVAGQPLTDYCDIHGLDVPERLRLFQQVLGAVQFAHANLVIHRDLKPSNVIVGANGRAMLLDFGIAKLIVPETQRNRHTQHKVMTPDYASPEQIIGQAVTTASDIYSLGVLLFELLTGERPYRLKHNTDSALEEAILTADPPRPSRRVRGDVPVRPGVDTPARLSRLLRGDLDTIVLKALKKAPGERYATVDAFAQDIERYLHGEPIAARPDSSWYRARKFMSRHKLGVASSGVALAAVLATACVALSEARSADAERDRALALSSRSEAVAEFLNLLITEGAATGKPVTVSELLARSETLVKSEYRDRPEHRAAVLGMLGYYYHSSAQDSRAESLLRQALEAVRFSPDADLRRKLSCDHAWSLASLGEVDSAKRALNSVVEDPQASAQQSAECLGYLSFIAQDAGDGDEALRLANRALARLRSVPHPPAILEPLFLSSVGFAEHLQGRNGVAEPFFARALALLEQAGRDRGIEAITVRNNWALVSNGAGNPRRALELYEQTLQIIAENDPKAAPPPYLLANRARSLEDIGRFADAERAYRAGLARATEAGTPEGRVNCLLGLASVSHQLGNLGAADRYAEEAASLISAAFPPEFPGTIALQNLRARLALTKGQTGDARTRLDSLIARSGPASITQSALLTRAELNLDEGQLAVAEADAQKALGLARAAQGGTLHSIYTGESWLMLGRVLAREGKLPASRNAFRLAVEHLSGTVDTDHPLLVRARTFARG